MLGWGGGGGVYLQRTGIPFRRTSSLANSLFYSLETRVEVQLALLDVLLKLS